MLHPTDDESAKQLRLALLKKPKPGLLCYELSMTLWLRRTGLSSPADADRADYLVIEHDKVIGRIYEERYVPAELRWFWSITEHVDPALGITTNGRAHPRGGQGPV